MIDWLREPMCYWAWRADTDRQADVTIRHAFPPNWTPPESGLWVHIQPWEYGPLPLDWLPHLRDKVHEVWAPSNYVKRIYVQSGISPNKIHVIPWAVDGRYVQPQRAATDSAHAKDFSFSLVRRRHDFEEGVRPSAGSLFGGIRPRRRHLPGCEGHWRASFYANSNFRERILTAMQDANNPQIIYIDEDFTAGQLASLYCSCQCLVAPYRGEGFGLPILEAMACGIPPIVPRGGATDDFVSEDSAYLLDAREIQNDIKGLCGPGTELEVSSEELRRALRAAMRDRVRTAA